MTENNTKTVNIRVSAEDWAELDDQNRSEICREALRAEAQMKRDTGNVKQYASDYADALSDLKEKKADVEVKKQMLANELELYDYDDLVLPEDGPDRDVTEFEQTVMFASNYAETYLQNGDNQEVTTRKIITDMNEEGRQLPRGIAEWIVELVAEKADI